MSAVTVSGNNFTKIALFAKFLSLGFPTTRTHSRIQTKYVPPVVEKYWDNLKYSVEEEHRAANLVVSGELYLIIKEIDEIVLMIITYIRYISL